MLHSTPSSRYGRAPGPSPHGARFFAPDWDEGDEADEYDDDATLELELTPEQMRVLAEAAAISGADRDECALPGREAPVPPGPRVEMPTPAPRLAQAVAAAPSVEPILAPKVATTAPPTRELTPRAPQVIVTVAIERGAARPAQPAVVPASPRAPIVIEHAPVKLKPVKAPVVQAAPTKTPRRRPPWNLNSQLRGALIAGVVAVAAFLSTIAYVAVTKARPVDMPMLTSRPLPPETTEPAPAPPVVEAIPPVRYANPFDKSEVFEFPPGTTEAEARDATAALLLQRGQERLTQLEAERRERSLAAHKTVRRSSTKLARSN